MAKKAIKQEGVFSFSELQTKLLTVNPNAKALHDSPYSNIDDYFSTGNYALNAQISGSMFKGIPAGRVTLLAGEPGAGKSFLILNACREAQKKGYYIIYIDTEWAIDLGLMERFGLDVSTNKVAYHPINTVEDVNQLVLTTALTLLEQKKAGFEIPKVIVAIDSLGNLSTRRELDGIMAADEKADMGNKQKLLKKLFSTCTLNMGLVGGTVIATQHTIANIGGYGEQRMIAGGIGQMFNASTIIQLTKAKLANGADKKTETGIISTSKIKKSRFTKKGIPVSFHISDYTGMNQFVGLEKYISWDRCGIQAGKIDNKNGFEEAKANTVSFAVKHLNKNVKPNQLFTEEVFTKEVLEMLDPYLQKTFLLPDSTTEMLDDTMVVIDNLADEDDIENGEIFND